MTAAALMLALVLTSPQDAREKPRVPDDSVELTVIGCLKGRALRTVTLPDARVERGPFVGERTFRVAGTRAVMDEVKRLDRQLVEVIGVVKRSALDDKGAASGRVAISGGSPAARSGGVPTGVDDVPVMDVTAVRLRPGSCGGR